MSALTIAWSMCAAASFVLGGLHVTLWLKDRQRWVYLLSTLMAVAAGATALTHLGLMHAESVRTYRTLLKLETFTIFLLLVPMVWFVYGHFGTARLWFAWTITSLWGVSLLINFLSPHSLVFAELVALKSANTFWGEEFVIGVGSANPWSHVANAASLLIVIYVLDASVRAWRRGLRQRAIVTGGGIAVFMVSAGIHTPLVDAGIIATPYMVSFWFLAIAFALSYELVSNAVELSREAALRQKLERELGFAQQIQKDCLPRTTPKLAGYDIAGWNRPAEQTGGDAYDFFAITLQRFGLFIADASGHGIGPALIVAECRALIRALASTTTDLQQVILDANSVLCEDLGKGRIVTACFAVLDSEAGTIECMSAGHAPLFHYISVEDRFVSISANTLPMGIVADLPMVASKPFPFATGDLFILITDGFYEWRRPDREQFGVDRLLEVIRRYRERSCDEIIRCLQEAVLDFSEGSEQLDDLTVIVLKRDESIRAKPP